MERGKSGQTHIYFYFFGGGGGGCGHLEESLVKILQSLVKWTNLPLHFCATASNVRMLLSILKKNM